MALPAVVTHTGSLNGAPAQGSIGAPSLQELLNTSFSGTYGGSKSARPSIVNTTDLAPYVIPFETITKVRMFAMKVRSGSLKLKLTSAVGTDQVVNVSDLFLIHTPFSGDELTAIKLVGTGDFEYFIAGDVS